MLGMSAINLFGSNWGSFLGTLTVSSGLVDAGVALTAFDAAGRSDGWLAGSWPPGRRLAMSDPSQILSDPSQNPIESEKKCHRIRVKNHIF